ncbi:MULTISPECIES: hypothetical protein [unclassified Sphingosinithalassobacter]|uniref:hypothetical protein n=1 Tax=unclassified Sphingosinithalassobacter TaxID=2676235 RepID=UPI00165D6698|nr:hypothetical protein [Sphingosinithalassobacter sp. CS137]
MLRSVRLPLVLASFAALSLAACSSEPAEVESEEMNIETIVETANTEEPMLAEPMDNFTLPEAPAADAAPVEIPSRGELTTDEQLLDDAAATGMTTRVDRSVPANDAPLEQPAN